MLKGIIANPNVAPHIRQNIKALFEHNIMFKFLTTFYYHKHYPLTSFIGFLSKKLKKEISRRSLCEFPYQLLQGKPFWELTRIVVSKLGNTNFKDAIWEISEHSFDSWTSKKVESGLDFILVCEHASLKTLAKAKSLKIKSFYEQPSIHHKLYTQIITNQFKAFPMLLNDAVRLTVDEKSKKRNLRRDQELALANFIICNSNFTKNSLIAAGIESEKIITIPLGFPDIKSTSKLKNDRKFIFMYAGNLTVNKGIHILLEAWKEISSLLKGAELHLYGAYFLPEFLKDDLPNNVFFFGSIPHGELMEAYQTADIFVNPTLADGFGMVITESMANGLPVIATKNSAAPELITNYIDGILIDAGSKNELKEKMVWSYKNPEKVQKMGLKAIEKAKSYSWKNYREQIVKEITFRLQND